MPKLTDRFLTEFALDEGKRDRLVFDTVCPGLGVRLTRKGATGTRTFIVQWTDPATKRKVREPLGRWGSITIAQAREAARARLGDVARGLNPHAEREKRRADADRERAETAFTFDALVTAWASLHLRSRRPRYASEAERAIRHTLAGLLPRPAARITRADALAPLDRMVAAGQRAMAGRTLAYARAAFRWAERRGNVAGNPFQGLSEITTGGEARDRALSDVELAEVWSAAKNMGYPFGPLFQLAILTLQRREEVAGMRWSELSADHSAWTISASRMKNGKVHHVHLGADARAVLASVARREGVDLIFTTTSQTPVSGFSKAKITLDGKVIAARAKAAELAGKKPEPLAPWRIHDLRRTGVSTLAALGIDSIVADMLLAHKAGRLHGVAAVYQRHSFAKEQASALDTWANHVVAVAGSATAKEPQSIIG